MKLTITSADSDLLVTVECALQDVASTIKEQIALQTGIAVQEQDLFFRDRQLNDTFVTYFATTGNGAGGCRDVLEQVGVADDDLLMLQRKTASAGLGMQEAQEMRDRVLRRPHLLAQLESRNPPLATAMRNNNMPEIQRLLDEINRQNNERELEMEQLMKNPMDIELQQKIEERIHQKNIEENFLQAVEHDPVVFGDVTMLHINMEVNGHPVQAFIDSGAQTTIMTAEFAERCGLLRLVDTRVGGTAFGVGEAKITGRVYQAPLKVSNQFVTSAVCIIDQKAGTPFIFGLDNLIRHQCCIDLKSMSLKFGTIGVDVPFLHEHEVIHTDFRLPGHRGNVASAGESSEREGGAGDVEFSQEKIKSLMELGFEREKCLQALRKTNGNQDSAASLLFEENTSF